MTERHVLGLSGGKDSAALAVYMRLHHPELDIQYFFTDTGKELKEVHEFLGKLEGFLGRPIQRLNPDRDFDFWLREYGNFLPSPRTRWCTRQLKLVPFRDWIRPWLAAGDTVHSYVAIRSDEPYRPLPDSSGSGRCRFALVILPRAGPVGHRRCHPVAHPIALAFALTPAEVARRRAAQVLL